MIIKQIFLVLYDIILILILEGVITRNTLCFVSKCLIYVNYTFTIANTMSTIQST